MLNNLSALSDFRSDVSVMNIYARDVYESLSLLEVDYPGFTQWYFEKVIPGVMTGHRDVVFSYHGPRISGVLIVKNTLEEKKICTLRVRRKFRKNGMGKRLFLRAFELLDTDKPMITVSGNRVPQFKPLLEYFGFALSDVAQGVYRSFADEYIYNGFLDVPNAQRRNSALSFQAKTSLHLDGLTCPRTEVQYQALGRCAMLGPSLG